MKDFAEALAYFPDSGSVLVGRKYRKATQRKSLVSLPVGGPSFPHSTLTNDNGPEHTTLSQK